MEQLRKHFGNTTDTLLFVSLLYTVLIMPFQKQEVPVWPGIALMTGVWLFSGNLTEKLKLFFSDRKTLLFSVLYLLYIIGYFYSENTAYALTDLLLKIPLLLFPLVISSSFVKEKTDLLLKTFHYAALLSAVFCVIRATYLTYSTGENYFYYYKLSYFFHVGNYAMYMVFAACISLYLFFKERKLIPVFSFVFFTVVIILLSARAQLIAFSVVLLSGAFYFLLKKETRVNGLVIIFSVLLISIAALWFVKGTRERFLTTKNEMGNFFSDKKTENYNSYLRFAVWQTGKEVIAQNPVFGVGTGDAKDELIKKAGENKYDIIVKKNLNYHNQFMQTWAAIGLPGLFALLLSILSGIFYSVKRKEFLASAFFILITVSFFTESALERQAGVIFYSFFSAILILADRNENNRIS